MNAEKRVFLELYKEEQKDIPDMRSINSVSLGMPEDVFNRALHKLQEKKIVSGVRFTKGYDGNIIRAYTSGIYFTENAEKYYNDLRHYELQKVSQKEEIPMKKKVFLSHSSFDLKYVKAIVKLMEDIGVPENGIFCSSMPGYNIPLQSKIYDYILEQLLEYEIMVYFILSSNFYNSDTCKNEVGAVWSLKLEKILIFLPEFDPEQMKGVMDSSTVGIKLDDGLETVRGRLGEMRDSLITFFGLPEMSEAKWERKREEFISAVL